MPMVVVGRGVVNFGGRVVGIVPAEPGGGKGSGGVERILGRHRVGGQRTSSWVLPQL